ncbi:MAG: hypothetical protein ACJAT1_001996 [Marivirga sp.]|jgi:hypothetical protein
MKKLLTLTTLCLFSIQIVQAQWKISTQIGGVNFLGATVNAAYSISLDNETISSLELAAGFGVL